MRTMHSPLPFLACVLTAAAACSSTPPSSTAMDGGSAPTASGDATAPPDPTTGTVPCPIGSVGCPCTPAGYCDATLSCVDGQCAQDACPVGALGCSCTPGGGCDAPNDCEAGTCVEGISKSCGDADKDEFEDCDLGTRSAGTRVLFGHTAQQAPEESA